VVAWTGVSEGSWFVVVEPVVVVGREARSVSERSDHVKAERELIKMEWMAFALEWWWEEVSKR